MEQTWLSLSVSRLNVAAFLSLLNDFEGISQPLCPSVKTWHVVSPQFRFHLLTVVLVQKREQKPDGFSVSLCINLWFLCTCPFLFLGSKTGLKKSVVNLKLMKKRNSEIETNK